MHAFRSSRQAGGKRPPVRRDADERGRRRRARARPRRCRRSGSPRGVSPARSRVEDRDDLLGPVAEHAARRLPVVRVGGVALREDQEPTLGATPSPGRVGGKLDAVRELDAGPRIVGEQQVAVEVDVVAEARDLRAGGDPEAGLDHAAEHHPEPERAGGVRHPHRLADPARLRELEVDPVRALGAGRDVGERVAVLVDVDRDGRAALQLGAVRVAGRKRLLAVLERHLRQQLERLVERPVLVHVDLERQRRSPRATACTRSRSSPSRPPSFSFSRRKPRCSAASARRAMSSGSPSQTVHEVGGPSRRRPSSL